jgi:hypothetical protein
MVNLFTIGIGTIGFVTMQVWALVFAGVVSDPDMILSLLALCFAGYSISISIVQAVRRIVDTKSDRPSARPARSENASSHQGDSSSGMPTN